MSSSNKKAVAARGIPQPFRPRTGPAHQFKPAVAQTKNSLSAANVRKPVAPPAYRPQLKPNAVQTKTVVPPRTKHPVAPPAYRPQPLPKVLQTKSVGSQQPNQARPKLKQAAPPVYRPQPSKVLLPKMAGGGQPGSDASRAMPKAPPVYRPQRLAANSPIQTKRPVAPLNQKPVASAAQRKTTTAGKVIARVNPTPHGHSGTVVQPWLGAAIGATVGAIGLAVTAPLWAPTLGVGALVGAAALATTTGIGHLVESRASQPLPTFDPDHLESSIGLINRQQQIEGSSSFFTDTTCSTTANRVTDALRSGEELSKGSGSGTLKAAMNSNQTVASGVVYRVSFGQPGMSQHVFTIEQKGTDCLIHQSWLDLKTLQNCHDEMKSMGSVANMAIKTAALSQSLAELETTRERGESEKFRAVLKKLFRVNYSDDEWAQEWQRNWLEGASTMVIGWISYLRKTSELPHNLV